MRFRSARAATAAFLCCAASAVAAQKSPRDAMLVTTSWLAEHLKDPNVVILHVGDPAKYESAHIPGARSIEMMDFSVTDMSDMPNMPPGMRRPPLEGPKNGLVLEMPSREQLRSQLEKFGISDNTKIVVYEANFYMSPSTRLVFTLDYAGLGKNTVVLDGGLTAWVRDKRETTSVTPPEPKPGKLSPLSTRSLIASAEFVRDHVGKPGYAVIDARSASFYDGVPQSRGEPKRYGHIAGARSLPFDSMHDQQTEALKPAAEIAALFAKAGVQPGDTIIGYCHVGQQATAMLFAARSLGHPVLLYDGSWNDWDKRDASFPVENPSAKKP
jgi:thiosulfate/3-mercaptopyruvate sulfurtransferase